MKLVTIVGARPQFIKAAVISRAITEYNLALKDGAGISEVIIHTGQHYDVNMSEVFFQEMSIPTPKYNLHLGGGSHGAMTGRMLEEIEKVLLDEKPQAVLVYGDTDSTLAGALAAAKLHIPVAHVEAGLRSFNMRMPEEINRALTDRVSRWLFCPTETAVRNLQAEGYDKLGADISCIGDVMYDAALFYSAQDKASDDIRKLTDEPYYLATVHRAENTDDPQRMMGIFGALEEIASRTRVILPVHPRTRKILQSMGMEIKNMTLIDPVGYFDMLYLQENSLAIFTDSGGVQKEAFFAGKPCVTLRDETEWVELVEHGFNTLVGADKDKILATEAVLAGKKCDFSMPLYGDGHAGEKIVKAIVNL